MQAAKPFVHLSPKTRCESIADLRRAHQTLAFVVTDDQRIERVGARLVAADHEFLMLSESHLHPGVAPPARRVRRLRSLRDHAFQAEPAHGFSDLSRGPR